MRTIFFLILISITHLINAQKLYDYTPPAQDFYSPFNKSHGVAQSAMLHPADSLQFVCIANPTRQYTGAMYWTCVLLEWLIDTGRYSTVYVDMPALEAMICDRYIKGDTLISMDHIKGITYWYYDTHHVDFIDFSDVLKRMRYVNMHSDKKISIKGLDYQYIDYSLLPYHNHLVDSIQKFVVGETPSSIAIKKNTLRYLTLNEAKERKEIGTDYDIFKRFFEEQINHENLFTEKEQDSAMLDIFLSLRQSEPAGSKAILFLSMLQLRDEPDIITFRTLLKKKFRKNEYLVYNLLDDLE